MHLAAGVFSPYAYKLGDNMKQEGINGCLKLTTGKNQVDADRIIYHLWEFHMYLIFQI